MSGGGTPLSSIFILPNPPTYTLDYLTTYKNGKLELPLTKSINIRIVIYKLNNVLYKNNIIRTTDSAVATVCGLKDRLNVSASAEKTKIDTA